MNPALVTSPQNLDVTVVDLRGKLTQSEESELHDMVARLSRSGSSCVVFNTADIGDIESSGFDELLAGCASIAKAGGGTNPQRATKCILTLLETTGLCEFVEVSGDDKLSWPAAPVLQGVPGSEYYLG